MDESDTQVEVLLPEDATAAREARSATRGVLGRWRTPRRVDDIVLVVSELVGNCVRRAYPPFWLRLHRGDHRVRVEVHDASSATPSPGCLATDGESGRGMGIAKQLADQLAVHQVEGDGKIVSATFATGPAGAHASPAEVPTDCGNKTHPRRGASADTRVG
jgi:anti-sigma regulatory factor (Ser/Thr protein kinase)